MIAILSRDDPKTCIKLASIDVKRATRTQKQSFGQRPQCICEGVDCNGRGHVGRKRTLDIYSPNHQVGSKAMPQEDILEMAIARGHAYLRADFYRIRTLVTTLRNFTS